MHPTDEPTDILQIERPDPVLLRYYLLQCLIIPPLFPITATVLYFKYHTMRYRFTDEGVSMSWGILFRRETILNYSRIQDIHIRCNIVERWLGLGRVLIQTASGSSSAEMTIEGLKQYGAIRDFLYSRMRGVHDPVAPKPVPLTAEAAVALPSGADGELAAVLRDVAAEMRALRVELAGRGSQVSGREDVS